MASICSVIRIVPISEAIFEPTLPARMRQRIVEENSNSSVSRVSKPTIYVGRKGFSVLIFAWMVRIAPMNSDMTMTMGRDCKPCFSSSRLYCNQNIRGRSGQRNTRAINSQYSPKCLIILTLFEEEPHGVGHAGNLYHLNALHGLILLSGGNEDT